MLWTIFMVKDNPAADLRDVLFEIRGSRTPTKTRTVGMVLPVHPGPKRCLPV